jgi:hypothetical protein
MSIAIERRLTPRFPAVNNSAVVEFKRGGWTRMVGASLINISMTGALLRMRTKPRVNSTLWLRLVHPARTAELLAIVVRIDDDDDVGVAFAQACNRTFFWTATRGEDFRSAFQDECTAATIRPEA